MDARATQSGSTVPGAGEDWGSASGRGTKRTWVFTDAACDVSAEDYEEEQAAEEGTPRSLTRSGKALDRVCRKCGCRVGLLIGANDLL